MDDIYFKKSYGKLYEKIEGGVVEEYYLNSPHGLIKNLFIKKEILSGVAEGPYYDITTPYGYGGPIILECKEGKKETLIKEYEAAFQKYCVENNIVHEFVRFHPIYNNAADFDGCYDVQYKRQTIQTELSNTENPLLTEYSASCRKEIRQALKAGVEFKVIHKPKDLEGFKRLYYTTMNRNAADSIYYFDDEYFDNCIRFLQEYIVAVEVAYHGELIGMGISFACGENIHVHLTGTLKEYHHLSSATIIQYALMLWGRENGYKRIHHGGGRTGELDDKLYLFKKKFGKKQELVYYTGQRTWNVPVHHKLHGLKEAANGQMNF